MGRSSRLVGRVVAISGAGSGIGRALAVALSQRGCALALSDIDLASVEETAARCHRALATRLDVRDADAVSAHAAEVVEHFGRVEVAINNAGVALTADAVDQSPEDVDRVLDINLRGVIHGSQAFLPHLIASGRGHLVNVSSLFGILGMPAQSAYCASKFGVRGYSESLAIEMRISRHPVTVHCVHPGGVSTQIARRGHVRGRFHADEVADFFDDHLAKLSPERAAEIVIRGVERGLPRIHVGADAKAMHALERLLGRRYSGLVEAASRRSPLAPRRTSGSTAPPTVRPFRGTTTAPHPAPRQEPDVAAG